MFSLFILVLFRSCISVINIRVFYLKRALWYFKLRVSKVNGLSVYLCSCEAVDCDVDILL